MAEITTMTVMMTVMMTAMMAVFGVAGNAAASQKPNIIFFVADDLGWNDVGWHNPSMLTPNLNRYAAQGVILNSSYVQYFCSPSRNAFMTGYFPYHTGLQHGVILEGEPRYVPTNFTMLPKLLKTAGYATHMVGKWHLGMCNWKYTPTYRGFDSYFGYYNGAEDYYTHETKDGGYDLRNDTLVAKDPGQSHFDYLFTDHTLKVISEHDTSTPLYLYLPFHLCHNPLQVPKEYEQRYSHIHTQDRRTYCGMVTMMDESFGNITQALDSRGLLDNTLLVFTTDYCADPCLVSTERRSGDLRRQQLAVTRGQDHILGGRYPGCCLCLEQEFAAKEILRQRRDDARSRLVPYHTTPGRCGPRYKDYKLMTGSPGRFNDWYPLPRSQGEEDATHEEDAKPHWKPQLYNIRNDPEERHDLADTEPQTMKMMMDRLHKWMASGVPPQNTPIDPRGDPKNWGGVWTPGWC
ncbi:arylsulfatase B-like isoform X2 [Littorina saxatilis]|uniref:arylsulfatase B-like isoform X2 n=1 Tax=Littorina saxatilis TaxID=31220 RepID=UPI0038B66F6F